MWIEDSLAAELPWLSVAQMVEVDRAMVDDFQILLLQMMELAGRHLASLARARFLADAIPDAPVVILAGPGGNGGGALVCARRLAGWGAAVSVVISATLVLPKLGLKAAGAAAHVGELYLGDIGVPRQLYQRSPLNLRVPDIFTGGDLVRLR